jgi:pilus assembly protein Flp/PilA
MGALKPRAKAKWNMWRVRGQGLVEYAMVLVMIAIVIIAILSFIGNIVFTNMYSKISGGFPGS